MSWLEHARLAEHYIQRGDARTARALYEAALRLSGFVNARQPGTEKQ